MAYTLKMKLRDKSTGVYGGEADVVTCGTRGDAIAAGHLFFTSFNGTALVGRYTPILRVVDDDTGETVAAGTY